MSKNILFQSKFDINSLNDCGKKFERVNRLHCKDDSYDVDLVLDVNAELFDVRSGQKVYVVLASSLTDYADDGHYNPNIGPSLMDDFSYVMHGRVFSIKHIENQRIEVQASFGGLLMRLRGEQRDIESFTVDMTFFILMRKV